MLYILIYYTYIFTYVLLFPTHICVTASSRRTRRLLTSDERNVKSRPIAIAAPRVTWAVLWKNDSPRTLGVPCVVPSDMLFPVWIKPFQNPPFLTVRHSFDFIAIFSRKSFTTLSSWAQADPLAPGPGIQAFSCFFAGHCSERQYACLAIGLFSQQPVQSHRFFRYVVSHLKQLCTG